MATNGLHSSLGRADPRVTVPSSSIFLIVLIARSHGILRYFFRRRSATTNHTNCRYSGTLPRRCGVEYNSFVPSRSRAILVTSYH
uniref:Uncharacterized protein n=1 Tax=Leersia perrieri TaxID=77586 RepID=A0A0D9WNN4_9ORYZ